MGLSSRIACIHVPDLPLQALLRAEPERRGTAVAVIAGPGPRARILHATAEAVGVLPGMTAAQAQAVCPDVVLRGGAEGPMRSALAALSDLALSFSPLFERRDGSVLLEVGDLHRLFPSEQALGTALLEQLRPLSLLGHVAIASSAGTAHVLAQVIPGVLVVQPGEERAQLGPLPLSALPLSDVHREVLGRWGLRRVGEFAALPRPKIAARLGAEGVALHRLACGEDRAPLHPTPAPESVCEQLDLDDPLDNLEPLSFLLRGLLSHMVARLSVRSLACQRYVLRLGLCPQGHEERPIALSAPTVDVATLLRLARVHLEAHPPQAPVRSISVVTTPTPRRPTQLSLLEPAGPSPERLSTTLARLEALCGQGRLGAPMVVDSYLPGQASLVPPSGSQPAQRGPLPVVRGKGAVSMLRPPCPAEVLVQGEGPDFLRTDQGASQGMGQVAGRIVQRGGPCRVRIGFAMPVLRDYYEVELEDGALYRLFQDLSTGSWFVDARYD